MSDAEIFNNWLYSMDKDERKYYIARIAKACFVTKYAIYAWIKGKCNIKTLSKIEINKIAQKNIFEIK